MDGEELTWPHWDKHRPLRPTDLSRTPSLATNPRDIQLEVSTTDDEIWLKTSRLRLSIGRLRWSLTVYDCLGQQLVRDTPVLPGNPPDAPLAMYGSLAFQLEIPERGLWRKYHHFRRRRLWFHAAAIDTWQADERGVEILAKTNDPFDRQLKISIVFLDEAIFQLCAQVSDTTSLLGFAHALECPSNELFYGLGERFTACNQHGQEVLAWSAAGPTGRRDWTYFPQPFVLTGSRYGILLDSTYRNRFRLCSDFRQRWAFQTEGPELRYHFVHDPDPMKIIQGLTDLAGKPPMPPKWSFAVLRNINGSEAAVRAEAKRLRQADIPCSALWYYDSLDEARHIGFPINPHHYDGDYDDIAGLNRDLKGMGYKSQTYLFPYVFVGTENYSHGSAEDYFVKNPRGDDYLIPFHTIDKESKRPATRPAAIIDFTNPDAVSWYQEIIRQIIVELNFDGWMHDFGEDVPVDAVFHNGKSGAEMHNIYPVLYQKATYEACMRHKADVSFYARAGYAGSQGYTMALWTGDQVINWSYDDGLPSVIAGALNLGFCGSPYIGPDIAGYYHSDDHPSIVSEELWIRWLQLGALCPIMRDLVAYYPIELWTSEQTIAAYRKYARLHMSLFPYLYSYALAAHRSGQPIMRHLYLAYPDDKNVRDLDTQYLLGDSLLIAPVLEPGVDQWRVYLPQGEWISWWDGKRYLGPRTVTVSAPLMQIPIFVKASAIIPQLPEDVDTLAPATDDGVRVADDDLIIDIFPSSDQLASRFQLWDGTHFRWDAELSQFAVQGSPVVRGYTLRFRQFKGLDDVRLVSSDPPFAELAKARIAEETEFPELQITCRNCVLRLQSAR